MGLGLVLHVSVRREMVLFPLGYNEPSQASAHLLLSGPASSIRTVKMESLWKRGPEKLQKGLFFVVFTLK